MDKDPFSWNPRIPITEFFLFHIKHYCCVGVIRPSTLWVWNMSTWWQTISSTLYRGRTSCPPVLISVWWIQLPGRGNNRLRSCSLIIGRLVLIHSIYLRFKACSGFFFSSEAVIFSAPLDFFLPLGHNNGYLWNYQYWIKP